LVGQAEALRRARGEGYRSKAWPLLQEALRLETLEKDVMQLRQEAVACLGDFVSLEPMTWTDFPANVNAIALHPNGGQLAIALSDGTVVLRELGTGADIAHLERHSGSVIALAFAPDGARLVSGDRGGTIHVWQAGANGEWALARTIRAEPALAGLFP